MKKSARFDSKDIGTINQKIDIFIEDDCISMRFESAEQDFTVMLCENIALVVAESLVEKCEELAGISSSSSKCDKTRSSC